MEVTKDLIEKAVMKEYRYREYDQKEKCNKYTYSHIGSRKYLAGGRMCDTCGETGHFTKSSLCKKVK